ncbi:histidine kinase [Comamonas testosteroni TK102]|uniref:histidine kinase n=1 Tax=Comamonas testosteroni TK102 TaxID=1392005 RepID=A0A076PS45_COMTE|nr:PAS domain S-box protein [Comamonas testosteroni]AIJ49654.1 histidine kinase [Comamonas testosteroni TK102]
MTEPLNTALDELPEDHPAHWPWRRWRMAWKRWSLWTLLVALVVSMLVTMVWLAGRYEASQVQEKLERDTANAVGDIRAALGRNLQDLLALSAYSGKHSAWREHATELLQQRRDLMRIEWRGENMRLIEHAETPYRTLLVEDESHLPELHSGKSLPRTQEVSFTEPDGTRLAMVGAAWRGSRMFTAQQLLDLPGNTLVLRMDSWHHAPSVFPNVMTALVTGMSIALVTVLVVLVRDNRRRLRAERDLGDALAFRKAMEDSLVTGMRARDLQGRITYVNPAFCNMVGFSAQELLGLNVAPYWPPELAQEYVSRRDQRLAGLLPTPRQGHESVFMRKDGSRFPVLIFEAPLITAQGQHTGWMSAFIDISEQRRMEEMSRASLERLQATARLATVGEMASMLSHELTQPLAAISSYATGSLNLLAHEPDTEDLQLQDLRMALERISFQADRAGKVIKSVRDFVRRRDKSREVVQPAELIDAVMPLVYLQAHKLNASVQLDLEADLPAVLCDVTMVEQVLLNLARNGMQAMDQPAFKDRVLTLTVRRSSDGLGARWVEFSIMDCGAGISAEVAEQLFTPFFTTRTEGMGLGLSLCRTVVEQHGGHLDYRPHLPQGTEFVFTLPAHWEPREN